MPDSVITFFVLRPNEAPGRQKLIGVRSLFAVEYASELNKPIRYFTLAPHSGFKIKFHRLYSSGALGAGFAVFCVCFRSQGCEAAGIEVEGIRGLFAESATGGPAQYW